jgi:hypothetical protein
VNPCKGYDEPMKNFFGNHYGFILGFMAGMGNLLFCIEAYKTMKNVFLYLGGFGLCIICTTIYKKTKNTAHSLDSPKENSEAKTK